MRRVALAFGVGLLAAVRIAAVSPPERVLHVALDSPLLATAVNPVAGQIYALGSEGRLVIIDEVTRRSSVVAVPSDAFGLAVDSLANRVYITSGTLVVGGVIGGLTVVDPSSSHTDFIVANYLGFPTANSSTHRVYVTNPYYAYHSGVGFHSIRVFDGETLAWHYVSITGSRSVALAVDETHDRVYVGTEADTLPGPTPLTIIDGQTEQTTDVFLGCAAEHVAVNPAADHAWATCTYPPSVFLIRAGRTEVYPVDAEPKLLTVNPSTGRAYVALDGRSSLLEIDPEFRVMNEIPLSELVTGLAANSQTDTIYASHAAAGTVTLVDGQSHETIDLEVGSGASSIVVDAIRDIGWVATAAGLTGLYGPTSPCFRCPRVVRRPP